jgi:hypothetical protein
MSSIYSSVVLLFRFLSKKINRKNNFKMHFFSFLLLTNVGLVTSACLKLWDQCGGISNTVQNQ